MTCTKPDVNELKSRLAEAEVAYHRLLTGAATASVSFGPSKSVSYTQANIAELRRYINDLRAQIAELSGCAPTRRATVRVRF